MSEEIYKQALDKINQNFDLSVDLQAYILNEEILFSRLKKILAERIFYLMQNNRYLLMSILYRIDVREEKIKIASEKTFMDEAAEYLAEEVIKRQLEKLKYRGKM